MPDAPNRGQRKCETCLLFTDKREKWNRDCVLDACECKAARKEFGRALCEHYKSPAYIDTSGKDLSGPAAGWCEWKCPPILKHVLWGQWDKRLVAATDWCHCWEPQPGFKPIGDQPQIDTAAQGRLPGSPAHE